MRFSRTARIKIYLSGLLCTALALYTIYGRYVYFHMHPFTGSSQSKESDIKLKVFKADHGPKDVKSREGALVERPSLDCVEQTLNLVYTFCGTPKSNVGCRSRYDELITSLKSVFLAAIASKYCIRIYLFVEPTVQSHLQHQYQHWSRSLKSRILLQFRDINYPKKYIKWRPLFGACATQRLFLHELLPDVDAILYMDVDTVVLQPLDALWELFQKFSDQQMFAVQRARADRSVGMLAQRRIISRGISYYPPVGIYSGLLLMNLTRIRRVPFLDKISQYLTFLLSRKLTVMADQDALNIYFYNHFEYVYVIPCQFHYTTDFCIKGKETCQEANTFGVTIIHGLRKVFCRTKTGFPSFNLIYKHFKDFAITDEHLTGRLSTLRERMKHNKCSEAMLRSVDKLYNHSVTGAASE